jgi:uncharacterized protein YodC (DUF2158 family)
MEDFQIGDIVRLKSGGPKMTICGSRDSDYISGAPGAPIDCVWFNQEEEMKTASFLQGTLEKVVDQSTKSDAETT